MLIMFPNTVFSTVHPYACVVTLKCCGWKLGTGTVLIPNCANVISTLTVHVHGVVTDWSYALAEFLVSSRFSWQS